MHDVWIRFSEDFGIPESMDQKAFKKLAAIFAITNSQSEWFAALNILGMDTIPPQNGIVRFLNNYPMINWSYMSRVVSGGSVMLAQDDKGKQHIISRLTPRILWRLVCIQWRVSQYLLPRLKPDAPLPEQEKDKVVESLALGLCLLSLTQRLKGANEENLALWLRAPENLSPAMQKTVRQIQAIQKRRTLLSPVWYRMFPPVSDSADIQKVDTSAIPSVWNGHGVCGADVSGRAMVFRSVTEFHAYDRSNGNIIAIFPRARPETVEVFPDVIAVLYGDGGTLSHACTVAREVNVPCITALGQGFVAAMATLDGAWLQVQPQNGVVQVIKKP